MPRFSFELLSHEKLPEWEAFVIASPYGARYYSHDYVALLARYAGGRAVTVVLRDGGQIIAGATLFIRSGRGGEYVENRTLLYYNGVLGSNSFYGLTESSLRDAIGVFRKGIESIGLASVVLHTAVPWAGVTVADLRGWSAGGWSVSPTYTYLQPLSDVWKRMDKNLRRLVRRAEEAGFSCAIDRDVENLYRLHADVAGRKDAPIYLPQECFIPFVSDLIAKGWGRLFMCRASDGSPASALLTLEGPWTITHAIIAASSKDHLATGASPLVRWKVAEAMSAEGKRAMDLTDASIESVSKFKRDCGGVLHMNFVLRAPVSSWRWRVWEMVQRWR